MSAPLSNRVKWTHIGPRILLAVVVAPFAAVLAAVFVVALLGAYAVTGEHPSSFVTPEGKPDFQADKIRADLRGATIH